MLIIIKLLAVFYVIFGVLSLIKPEFLKKYTNYWREGKKLYIGGMIALPFVVIMLAVASQCQWPIFVYAMGILGSVKVIAIFVLGPKKFMPMLDWWDTRPDSTLRLISLVAIAIGILLFYAV